MKKGNEVTLVGVVSYGSGCGRPGYFGVYADVYRFVPWIKSVLAVTNDLQLDRYRILVDR